MVSNRGLDIFHQIWQSTCCTRVATIAKTNTRSTNLDVFMRKLTKVENWQNILSKDITKWCCHCSIVLTEVDLRYVVVARQLPQQNLSNFMIDFYFQLANDNNISHIRTKHILPSSSWMNFFIDNNSYKWK